MVNQSSKIFLLGVSTYYICYITVKCIVLINALVSLTYTSMISIHNVSIV